MQRSFSYNDKPNLNLPVFLDPHPYISIQFVSKQDMSLSVCAHSSSSSLTLKLYPEMITSLPSQHVFCWIDLTPLPLTEPSSLWLQTASNLEDQSLMTPCHSHKELRSVKNAPPQAQISETQQMK